MTTHTHQYIARAIELGWLTTLLLVPLLYGTGALNQELPKVVALRALTGLMLAAHLLALAGSRQRVPTRAWLRRPLVRPLLAVAAVTLLTTLTAIDPRTGLLGSYHRQQGALFTGLLLLWALLVAAHLRTAVQRKRLALTVTAAGTLTALAALLLALLHGEALLRVRPGGTLGNPIFLGAMLIMTIPFTLAGLLDAIQSSKSNSSRKLTLTAWLLALLLQLAVLLITKSRGPWLGLAAGLILFSVLVLWPAQRRRLLGGLAVLVLLTGGLAAGLRTGIIPAARMAELPFLDRIAAATDLSGGTTRVRLILWEAALDVVRTWPAVGLEPDRLRALRPLVGYGPDTAAYVYMARYPAELGRFEDRSLIWDRAHNETLDILTMQGWLGIGVTLLLGIAIARRGWQLWRTAPDITARAWIAAPLAALLAHAVEVQFAFSVITTRMLSWLCVAWLLSDPPAPPLPPVNETTTRRRRSYAIIGAVLLLILTARVEGGLLWADLLAGRARRLDDAGQWQESIALYDRATTLAPWIATYHEFRAEAFFNLALALPEEEPALKADLFAAADRGLARARRLAPLELEHYSNAGAVHAAWSDFDAAHLETAVVYFDQALTLAPTRVGLYLDLGHLYHNHARYADALAQYEAALALDGAYVDAYYAQGMALLDLNEPAAARSAFATALHLDPKCAECAAALASPEE